MHALQEDDLHADNEGQNFMPVNTPEKTMATNRDHKQSKQSNAGRGTFMMDVSEQAETVGMTGYRVFISPQVLKDVTDVAKSWEGYEDHHSRLCLILAELATVFEENHGLSREKEFAFCVRMAFSTSGPLPVNYEVRAEIRPDHVIELSKAGEGQRSYKLSETRSNATKLRQQSRPRPWGYQSFPFWPYH